jgi:hypothetical protein
LFVSRAAATDLERPAARQGPPLAARVEAAQLQLPGHVPLTVPGLRSTLRAAVPRLARLRGGSVVFSLAGDIDGEGTTFHLSAEATTFVRDLVQAATTRRGPEWPRLGDDAGMR